MRRLAGDALSTDPRWERLERHELRCASCGAAHRGLFDLALDRPANWPGGPIEPNGALRLDGNFLSSDLCVVGGEAFLVRTVLRIPLRGAAHDLGLGVWSSLSLPNFRRYVETFDGGEQAALGPWFSWLCVQLAGWPSTGGLASDLVLQDGRQRPLVRLHEADHPLVRSQREGIDLDRLLDLYAANGHDLRAALDAS